MANDVVGSVVGMTLEGIAFRVASDANVTFIFTKYENSMVATSGDSMRKMIKRVPAMESLVLVCNGAELVELKSFAEQIDDVKFSVTFASGDTWKSQGGIEIENIETEEGRVTVQLQPREDWTPFLA